ncbi:MAG: 16S rRNA (cytosine(1402)-N(4))-methyltransferase RsmH, partial [Deltaproteobacteria bacterium]|nr:16S rRNA (cytosine(1402)-N(4))-methyltransferase RsmH [Deltaproteobacteria bacterium]MBW2344343.1 16S rRNA (cytosine(1402)-N(4))-methyltransferase RsmH [Deltaproteobacteria bacterium]
VGNGGHSLALSKGLIGKGSLICLDRDPDALAISKKRLAPLSERVSVIRASYADLDQVLMGLKVEKVDGVLLDLGMSSYQLEESGRGFSFLRDEPLDMRMDTEDELTARDLVNSLSPKELESILKKYGEERRAKSIVRAIVRAREQEPIETSSRLADLIRSVSPPSYGPKARHPATRTFQALRIAVNKELQNIEIFLNKIPFLLAKGGRLVVLSYHSLEDRYIKKAMFDWEKGCTCPPDFPQCVCGKVPMFKRLFKKGIKPDKGEINENPRARSAIMRAAERI